VFFIKNSFGFMGILWGVLLSNGRLLLGLKPSRLVGHTVKLLSLQRAELVDLHGCAVQ
jgi:hypothetical protein